MLVEDEFLIRLTLAEVLGDEGYDVVEAETGDQALALLVAGPPVALLLTDIQLPGTLDGHSLVIEVRRTMPDLPVIFMTGRPDTVANRTEDGRDSYLAKPYLPSDVSAAIRRMLAG